VMGLGIYMLCIGVLVVSYLFFGFALGFNCGSFVLVV